MTDAFGRLRVSNIFTTFEYSPSATSASSISNYDQDRWVSTLSGSSALSYNSSNYINMSCTASGDYIVRQSKLPMIYQPGKSRLLFFSGVLLNRSVSSDSVIARIGIYSTSGATPVEGHYFKTDGNTLYWVETLGSTENAIAQSSWNIDVFDGTGPSGYTLTTSNLIKNILLIIDQEWLGVGRVRVGFKIDGKIYYAHQFTHSTTDVPYTTTPRLPITYQINATTIASPIAMRQFCCTCISEGGYFPLGKRISVATTAEGFNMNSSSSKYIIAAIRANSSYPTVTIKPIHFEGSYPSGTGRTLKLELQVHSSNGSVGSISGSLSYSNCADSGAQYALGDGSQTVGSDGYIITTCLTTAQTSVSFSSTDFEQMLSRVLVSKYDTLYLVGSGSANNMIVSGSVDFVVSA